MRFWCMLIMCVTGYEDQGVFDPLGFVITFTVWVPMRWLFRKSNYWRHYD